MLQRPPRFGRPLLFVSPVWLLRSANGRGIRLGTRRPNWRGWRFHREEFVVIQVAVQVPRQLRRLGTKSRPSTFQENDGHNPPDRKSTRLNSSHRCISYAVFCLKKTKTD